MSKFKVGDIVVRVGESHREYSKGMTGIVTFTKENFIRVDGDSLSPQSLWEHFFDFRVDEAIKTLESAGYIITPPPGKLKGKAYILRDKNHPNPKDGDGIFIRPTESLTKYGHCEVIAIVPWTEGQGLEDD